MRILRNILLFIIVIIALQQFLYHTSIGDVFVSYKMKYKPNSKPNKAFKNFIVRQTARKPSPLLVHDYKLKTANSSDFMQGILVEVWYDGTPYLYGTGSGNSGSTFIPSTSNCHTYIHKDSKVNSTGLKEPVISVQTQAQNGNLLTSGRNLEMVMASDGEFKVLEKSTCSYGEDSIIPVIAYFTPNRYKDHFEEYSKAKPSIENMNMLEFIETYVKRYDGFIVYARNRKFERFFDTFSEDLASNTNKD